MRRRKSAPDSGQHEVGKALRTMELPSHWTPAQAYAVFEMLDELRDLLWFCYGGRIQQFLREDRVVATSRSRANSDERDLPF